MGNLNMNYFQEKASQISGVLQILALVQPVLVQLFQFAESVFPSGGGNAKMEYIKACIAHLIADIPDLQAKFEVYWKMLVGLIEAALTISKAAGLLKQAAPAATPVTPSP